MSSAASLLKWLKLENIDIAFITEHKLFNHSKYFMDTIAEDYKNITFCDETFNTYGNLKCGKGGVSILYKSSLDFSVRNMDEISDERIIGLEIYCNNNAKLYAFCIYMPSANYPLEKYCETLSKLQAICNTYSDTGTIVILGDMNAEVLQTSFNINTSNRDNLFSNFLSDNDMFSLTQLPICTGPKYTFTTMQKNIRSYCYV